ncbi:MAG: hypothetical protein E7335_10920 [Clostridiales bacterium]|nr:hypothetical protein [Clostridiales bacterium]
MSIFGGRGGGSSGGRGGGEISSSSSGSDKGSSSSGNEVSKSASTEVSSSHSTEVSNTVQSSVDAQNTGIEKASSADGAKAAANKASANEISSNSANALERKGEKAQENTEKAALSNKEIPRSGEKVTELNREILEKENQRIKSDFETFAREHWQEEAEVKLQLINAALEQAEECYSKVELIAEQDEHLYQYSDHTPNRHIRQVVEKLIRQLEQLKQAAAEHPETWANTFSNFKGENTLIYAGVMHDVGMAGSADDRSDFLKAYSDRCAAHDPTSKDTVGDIIRKNHSGESAMYILSQRENIQKLNAQIQEKTPVGEKADLINADEAALLVALHSKSANMGGGTVLDLSDHQKILDYTKGLKEKAAKRGLEFNDDFLYTIDSQTGERVANEEAILRVATEAMALRLGDSFRPSSDVQLTQSGKAVHIDVSKVDKNATNLEAEMNGAVVSFYNENGIEETSHRLDIQEELSQEEWDKLSEIDKETLRNVHSRKTMSKAFAVGEKNILDMNPGAIANDNGTIYTDVYLRDGNLCPCATAFAIGERFGESNTGNMKLRDHMCYRIHSLEPITEDRKALLQFQLQNEIEKLNNKEMEKALKARMESNLIEDGSVVVEEVEDATESHKSAVDEQFSERTNIRFEFV